MDTIQRSFISDLGNKYKVVYLGTSFLVLSN